MARDTARALADEGRARRREESADDFRTRVDIVEQTRVGWPKGHRFWNYVRCREYGRRWGGVIPEDRLAHDWPIR
jgi:hypothetical protein